MNNKTSQLYTSNATKPEMVQLNNNNKKPSCTSYGLAALLLNIETTSILINNFYEQFFMDELIMKIYENMSIAMYICR